MTQYFLVEGGQITVGPKPLPRSWRNFSGLNLLSAEKLAALGWLPQEVVGFTPFDPETQVRTGPDNDIQADKVVSTYTVREMTEQEISDKEDEEINASSIMNERVLRGLIIALNNGDMPVGQNLSMAQIKAAIKSNMP